MTWEPLRLSDDAARIRDCWRSCYTDDPSTRIAARWDWLWFAIGVSLALSVGFAIGAWMALLLDRLT